MRRLNQREETEKAADVRSAKQLAPLLPHPSFSVTLKSYYVFAHVCRHQVQTVAENINQCVIHSHNFLLSCCAGL